MNAIKKKLQTLKIEKDLAIDRADACDQQAKEAVRREERLRDQLEDLGKKLAQMRTDLDSSRQLLRKSNANLEHKDKVHLMVSCRARSFVPVAAAVTGLPSLEILKTSRWTII